MLSSAFDIGEEIHLRKLTYIVHLGLWEKFDLPDINVDFSEWTSIKYLNDEATDFHADIDTIPNNKGGLYLFYVRCPVVTGITDYPFYIGRAQLTKGQNLRKRVKEYYLKYSKETERPKITRMFKYWGAELRLAFLRVDENNEIIELEKKIINSLLLPMNDEIPDVEERQAVKAFQ